MGVGSSDVDPMTGPTELSEITIGFGGSVQDFLAAKDELFSYAAMSLLRKKQLGDDGLLLCRHRNRRRQAG